MYGKLSSTLKQINNFKAYASACDDNNTLYLDSKHFISKQHLTFLNTPTPSPLRHVRIKQLT